MKKLSILQKITLITAICFALIGITGASIAMDFDLNTGFSVCAIGGPDPEPEPEPLDDGEFD